MSQCRIVRSYQHRLWSEHDNPQTASQDQGIVTLIVLCACCSQLAQGMSEAKVEKIKVLCLDYMRLLLLTLLCRKQHTKSW